MSRELPARPNLEYLKKAAKDRLRELQQRDPTAQLADAQHLVAREYGFASWPKLRAFVDEVASHPLNGRWTLDTVKSSPNPDYPVWSAQLDIEVRGGVVTIQDVVVAQSGEVNRTTNTLHADDVARSAAHGYALRARWRDARTLQWEATQHGQAVGRGEYVLSADGSALMLRSADRSFAFTRA